MSDKLIAVLDACVLYPAPLRDFFMQLSVSDLFKAKWTDRIHEEWIYNLKKNRPDLKVNILKNIAKKMNTATRDCVVEDYEKIIDELDLPDSNDRHVLAAAIKSEATFIVTFNLKDFPKRNLGKYKVEAINPDDFIMMLMKSNHNEIILAAKTHRERLKNPPKSVNEYLLTLEKQKLKKTVKALSRNIDEL